MKEKAFILVPEGASPSGHLSSRMTLETAKEKAEALKDLKGVEHDIWGVIWNTRSIKQKEKGSSKKSRK